MVSPEIGKTLLLLGFALLFFRMNLKAGSNAAKFVTFWSLWVSIAGAVWFALIVVLS